MINPADDLAFEEKSEQDRVFISYTKLAKRFKATDLDPPNYQKALYLPTFQEVVIMPVDAIKVTL